MPKTKKTSTSIESQLIKEVNSLTKEIKNIKNLEFIKIFKHPFKFLWFSFLKGVMVGFGSVIGATVLVAVFIYLMAKISFVPIVGNFVEKIIDEVTVTDSVTTPVDSINIQTTDKQGGGFATEFSAIVPASESSTVTE